MEKMKIDWGLVVGIGVFIIAMAFAVWQVFVK